jgi:cyclophilin family peptidyl-prolyl cis-trans isomerase
MVVRVIPKYDPSKLYRARIDTEEGPIYVDFFQDVSPIAVKAFIDMANAGFYDGLLFHEIHPGARVVGGDTRYGNATSDPITFPQEQSDLPHVAGTVLMMPVGAAPPSNGSAFMILLRPEPSIRGQATILGQVVEGLDAVMRISQRPSTQSSSEPFFKPLKDIEIRGVVITERPTDRP